MVRSSDCDTPVLGSGAHAHPRRGACLLELSGTLAGGFWSDRPLAVDPALAALARLVNDLSSDAARKRLIGLAPWLAGATVTPPEGTTTAVACQVGRIALYHADPRAAERLAPALAAIKEPPHHERWPRFAVWLRRRHAVRLVRSSARMVGTRPDSDDLLNDLLVGAINLSRHLAGLPDLPIAWDDGTYPLALPVRVESRAREGADWPSLYCTALLDRWPTEMQEAWRMRTAEVHGNRASTVAWAPPSSR